MSQVVIVGAGPTGATLALLLVQRGISVVLVEAARDFRRVFRGEGLMPSGLDALAQMGLLPLMEQVPHRPIDGWEFFLGDRPLFHVPEPMGAEHPCTLVSQPPLLEALVAEAQTYPHFEFVSGIPVKDLRREGDRIAGVVLQDGRKLKADLVIGADGRSSGVRQRAGLELVSEPSAIDVLWFKVAAHPKFVEANTFTTIVDGDRVFSVFHGAEEGKLHIAWVLTAAEGDRWRDKDWVAEFSSLQMSWLADHIRTHAETLEAPMKLSVLVGQCPQWWQPGLLLLGDAAHPMSPVRAQGINLALRDVMVAADYLVPLLQANADPGAIDAVLPRIQAERQPEITKAQRLQQAEAKQGELIRHQPVLRQILRLVPPSFKIPLRLSWQRRQIPLREGFTSVRLTV
ncbi:FAD-dependent monooxygenase [Leptolyngbya sp. AN02str]|uniref:FAD-dependent monooxygenase n=1 Tax=Leptolyngbya sp. AN02str TaxID=3423363 RepID=UPI003D317979